MQKLKNFLIPFLVVLVSVLVVVLCVLGIELRKSQFAKEFSAFQVIEAWQIYKIEPVNDLFNVTLKSSTGRIREYNNLASFGLSKDGQLLAVYIEKQLQFVDLLTDSTTKLNINLENIRISSGENIGWDNLSNTFGTTLLDIASGKTYIALANIKSSDVRLIEAPIPYNNLVIEPVYFSPFLQQVLVRTYIQDDSEYPKEDGSMPALYELPVYLTKFDFNGKVTNSLKIADYSTVFVDYGYDSKGRVKYYLSTETTEDYIPDNKYTKISF